jgi:hypothetical protein
MSLVLTILLTIAFLGASVYLLLAIGVFIGGLLGRDPIDVDQGYMFNALGNSVPLIYASVIWYGLIYLYWIV